MANGALMSVLQKHLALVDARSIVLHSTEGAELMAVSRGGQSSPEDLAIVGALVPSFSSSSDHMNRLGLGPSKMVATWTSNSIVVQSIVPSTAGSVVISIVCEDSANLGLINENIIELQVILRQCLS